MRRFIPIFLTLLIGAQRPSISTRPDTPFKLATFELGGKVRVGIVLGTRVLDIAGANAALTRSAGLAAMTIPTEMRELIESYERVKPRLYQIANYYKSATDAATFAFDVDKVSI